MKIVCFRKRKTLKKRETRRNKDKGEINRSDGMCGFEEESNNEKRREKKGRENMGITIQNPPQKRRKYLHVWL